MKSLKIWMAALLGMLAATLERLTKPPGCVALPNELGLITEHGQETLMVDPAATLPVATRYLLWKRGSAANYATLSDGAALPLGPSPDSPYQIGDFLTIYRLGAKKGFELGISAGAIAQDNLVAAAAAGKVKDLTTSGAGTWYVVGRCVKAVTGADQEVVYVPCFPYAVTQ